MRASTSSERASAALPRGVAALAEAETIASSGPSSHGDQAEIDTCRSVLGTRAVLAAESGDGQDELQCTASPPPHAPPPPRRRESDRRRERRRQDRGSQGGLLSPRPEKTRWDALVAVLTSETRDASRLRRAVEAATPHASALPEGTEGLLIAARERLPAMERVEASVAQRERQAGKEAVAAADYGAAGAWRHAARQLGLLVERRRRRPVPHLPRKVVEPVGRERGRARVRPRDVRSLPLPHARDPSPRPRSGRTRSCLTGRA